MVIWVFGFANVEILEHLFLLRICIRWIVVRVWGHEVDIIVIIDVLIVDVCWVHLIVHIVHIYIYFKILIFMTNDIIFHLTYLKL